MTHVCIRLFVCLLGICLMVGQATAQTPTHTWKNTPVNTDWNNPANWDQGTVPASGHTARIDYCTTCPTLTSDITLDHLIVNGGKMDMAGKHITAITVQFQYVTINSQGAILDFAWQYWLGNTINGSITLNFNNAQLSGYQSHNSNYYYGDLTYSLNIGKAFIDFNSYIVPSTNPSVASPKFKLNVASGSISLAALTFPGEVEINSLDKGYIFFANDGNITFKGKVKITQNTVNDTYAYTRFSPTDGFATIFEKGLEITNGTGYVLFGPHGDCTFKEGVSVQSTPVVGTYLSGVYFGDNSTSGQQTFLSTLTVGSETDPNASYKSPNLRIANCIFQTSTPQKWKMDGGGKCTVHQSTFAGNLDAIAPHIYLSGSSFQMPVTFTKTANGDDLSNGGNTFHGKVILKNMAQSGMLKMANQTDDTVLY